MDEVALALDIKFPEEWEQVTTEYLLQNGGSSLLTIYGNIHNALRQIYPEIEWKESRSRSPHGYWNNKDNQKIFLEGIASKLGIKKYSDWGRVTILQIKELGGISLLHNYNDSLFASLKNVFPGISSSNVTMDRSSMEKILVS